LAIPPGATEELERNGSGAPVIMLTGATGFVGRELLQLLAQRPCRLRLPVRAGTEARLPRVAAIERIVTTADLWAEDVTWWSELCRGVDTVIHAAWYAEPGCYLESSRNFDCLTGSLQLAQGAAAAKVRRFIGLGTCFEYDLGAGDLTIDTALRPMTPYALAKVATYTSLAQSLPMLGVEFAWCRLFYLYGEGEDQRRLVPYLRSRLAAGEPVELSSGDQIRDYLDVRDAARMIADVARSCVLGPVNICSGEAVSVRHFAERIADEYGRRDLLRFGARAENLTDAPRVVGVR
jgi:nucleoside-diphosphate-sugar epimerase